MDAIAPNRAELESARVSRYELVDMMHKDGFEDVITGEPDSCRHFGRDSSRYHRCICANYLS